MVITNFHLKAFVFLIVFSPAIVLGPRSIYLFEIVLIAYLGMSLLINKTVKKDFFVFYMFLTITFVILLIQFLLYGQLMALEFLRLSLTFSVLFIINLDSIDFDKVIRFTMTMALFAALIGIVQTMDGLIFSNAIGVNKILSAVYPYPGELVESALNKAGGLQLKTSSGHSATSVFDGHPILFSDFLVLATVLFVYYKRYLGLSVVLLALICTFTRGAWIATLFTILYHLFLQAKHTSKRDYLFFLSLIFILGLIVYSIESLRGYFEFRVLNTLAAFDLIEGYDIGRSYDPRTETVWPNFFAVLSKNGVSAYLWGVPTRLPTDSGYLTIIQNEGVVGLLLLIGFLMYIYTFKIAHKSIALLLLVSLSVVFVVHPVFQGYKSLYFFVFLLLIFQVENSKFGKGSNVSK
jgi:hypothetical protein